MTLYIAKNKKLERAYVKLRLEFLAKRKYLWHRMCRVSRRLGLSKSTSVAFLVGSGRSGTDILAHCLDQSLDVRLINEYDTLAFVNWRLKKLGDVNQVAISAGAPLVLFKPIVETMRIKELLEYFPYSRAIFLIRDYRDAINSMVKFFGEAHVKAVHSWVETGFERFPLVPEDLKNLIRQTWNDDSSVETACGIYWLLYNSSYLFLNLSTNSKVYLVDYKNLVTEPGNTLLGVCEFLDLNYKKRMLADIYTSSVKRQPAPDLLPALERRCAETWDRLNSRVAGAV